MLKPLLIIGFTFSFSTAASAQVYYNDMVGKHPKMSPLLFGAFRKPAKPNPLLSEYVKPSKYELMYWPYFPLTAQQVQARNSKYDRPIAQQIIGGIAESYINSLLYGKKMPAAVTPKF